MTAHRYDNTPTGGGRLVAGYYYSSLLDYLDDRDDNDTLDDWEENRTFSYDGFGRNVAISLREMVSGSPTLVRTERHTFDADGRMTMEETPEGVFTHEYDRAGRMTRTYAGTAPITTDTVYGFDVLGRIISATSSVRNGQTTGESPTRYYFDANDRFRCQETLDSAQTLLSSIEYEYGMDDSGTQQTKKTERDSQGDTTNVTA